jgi:hypothetical protein
MEKMDVPPSRIENSDAGECATPSGERTTFIPLGRKQLLEEMRIRQGVFLRQQFVLDLTNPIEIGLGRRKRSNIRRWECHNR